MRALEREAPASIRMDRRWEYVTVAAVMQIVCVAMALVPLVITTIVSPGNHVATYIVSGTGDVINGVAIVLFAIALFAKGKTGNVLCTTSAAMGITASLLTIVLSFLPAIEAGAPFHIMSVFTGIFISLAPLVLVFLAKIFLGRYFAANVRKQVAEVQQA